MRGKRCLCELEGLRDCCLHLLWSLAFGRHLSLRLSLAPFAYLEGVAIIQTGTLRCLLHLAHLAEALVEFDRISRSLDFREG